MMNSYPKVREIHPIPFLHDEKPSFMLRDPLQLNGQMLIIPQEIAPLLYICDGTRDLETIRVILQHHYKITVQPDELAGILEVFDEAFLIENKRSQEAYQAALADYRSASVRPPASAGGSYPAEPATLHRMLQDHLEAADTEPAETPVRGILSPHIDFERGASVYAAVWKRAMNSIEEADLILLIGTDHYGSDNPVTLTRQHFATPFGTLPTDVNIVNKLAGAIGEAVAFNGELFHKTEHSLELPLIWLHHLLGDKVVPVVPILCGTLDPTSELFANFVDSLRRISANRRVLTVISGDLSHVGPEFGSEPLNGPDFEHITNQDNAYLNLLESGHADVFLEKILENDNVNNVCGVYPLYLALSAFGYETGERNGYAQCPADEDGTSIVSIAGMLFR